MTFNKIKGKYEATLRQEMHKCHLNFNNKRIHAEMKNTRKRNVIWFTPQFNLAGKAMIGGNPFFPFFSLVNRIAIS